ncbi:hypothetical protein GTP46_26715 [Duganella sp. FT135W]|uniref:Uncharacterized protein n=1 Tax=Duganella flavida TaxID=2692175 RepID=A0A6L8KHK5_9BURK|nr:hypothetical protein [Duganella flavida]MYM26227.1 hypothetical protein [Duganella flavida]
MSGKFVKKIRREYYTIGKEIDTDVYNYGLILSEMIPAERMLFEGLLNIAEMTGAVLDTLWRFVAAFQERPLPSALAARLLSEDMSPVDLSDYILDLDGITIIDVKSLRALRTLAFRSRQLLVGGGRDHVAKAYFWECFYERVRGDGFPYAPSRSTCFFVFSDVAATAAYAQKHYTGSSHDYLFCHVEATASRTSFSADMAILDDVTLKETFASAAEQIRRYWRQERSEEPLMEVLFQGKVCLGERIRLGVD